MKLQDWIYKKGMNHAAFAELAKQRDALWSRTKVHRIIKKGKKPSDKEMADIFAVTDGAVQPNDFYDLPEQASSPAPSDSGAGSNASGAEMQH